MCSFFFSFPSTSSSCSIWPSLLPTWNMSMRSTTIAWISNRRPTAILMLAAMLAPVLLLLLLLCHRLVDPLDTRNERDGKNTCSCMISAVLSFWVIARTNSSFVSNHCMHACVVLERKIVDPLTHHLSCNSLLNKKDRRLGWIFSKFEEGSHSDLVTHGQM